ncbi:hypothetical protein A3J20_01155 [Candidatus Gottesmanbacteria bacterium RIFCSPLOWO2_02_FULL_42_29]|uniref:Uncharacterized protein n=1 Tax=Candidatus Gottesmanbacteria bacterium RIFCSPLOWO2_01_FULL_42_22 TaxID=1798391 RepID=A0A1F6BEJ5_9BACT|nr:MAG: hypothetical protein UV46_C0025G0012 [Candidatus Gottesmanbacteria bacterium GW2011_GWC2_42_8]OGG35354.1 MAG: hypothetical protein A2968_04565 [Candidatus Gottesmanbacteria bacterium RIFCSPLOWO2_01_FULL_42_22]OGG35598.1 MAG: hypothetical protein A3G68_01270 [Candidatus Gottesmanbacteria bacterium RIFCSPLOWO2_12_FULL_42_10]OGG39115.1 MAG: hypothetical protein A3J20_01155 [Candidatus Gottesmanbacteria bacterium RIFCSPLOWO2_02_FULL_42_29]
MIKSDFISSSLSITKWAYQKSKLNSIPEWDELITTIENADLLLTLVLDQNCPRRASVLKCLYSLVGTSASKHVEADIAKINMLLDKAKSSSDQVILNWVNRSRIILIDLKKYDYVEWCQGGFSEKDLPIVH